MTAFLRALRLLVRIAFLLLLLLGLYIWIAGAGTLVSMHVGLGFLFVLLLIVLGVAAAVAGASKGLAALTVLWALLVPVVGFGQLHLMPGGAHWVIRLLHLLVGMAAMPFAERAARQALERTARRSSAPA